LNRIAEETYRRIKGLIAESTRYTFRTAPSSPAKLRRQCRSKVSAATPIRDTTCWHVLLPSNGLSDRKVRA